MTALCDSVEGASLAQSVPLFPLSSHLPDTPMPMPMPMRRVLFPFIPPLPRVFQTHADHSYNLQDGTKCWIIPIPCCC